MVYLIINWVLGIMALLGVTIFVPGFRVSEFGSALIAVAVLGLMNAALSISLKHLNSMVTSAACGTVVFLLDTVLFRLAGLMIPGFAMTGFVPALSGAMALMAANAVSLRYSATFSEQFEWDEPPAELPPDVPAPAPPSELDAGKLASTHR